jgi:hypothetical protein
VLPLEAGVLQVVRQRLGQLCRGGKRRLLDLGSFFSILERLQRGKYPGERLLKAVNVDRCLVRPAQTQQESEQRIEVQKLMLLLLA